MTRCLCSFLLSALFVGTLGLVAVTADEPPPPPVPQEGVEVMARGPVHEAFAEPTAVRPQPPPVVPKQPPAPVDELPPEQKPAGDNVVWIPGYWAWDQDKSDFLWVSGLWRTSPPGRQWMPGNWQEVEGGWLWTPGFWTPAGQGQMQYLPAPPASLDEGPTMEPPQPNSVYVPGCWVYRQTRYFWRPGFWSAFRPGWVWIPAHYIWTPGGFLFVEGYWDHPLETRGLLFAPVRLAARLLGAGGWLFTPQYVIQPDFLLGALFVRPTFGCYYFGDYFAASYTRAGFIPWIDYRVGRFAYDPNFNYYRLGYAGYGNWENGLRNLYRARFNGTVPRPPVTLTQQTTVVQNLITNRTNNVTVNRSINITNVQNVSVLAPLSQMHNARPTHLIALANVRDTGARKPLIASAPVQLQPINREERVQVQKAAAEHHAVAQQRQELQGRLLHEGRAPVKLTDKPHQAEIKLPRLPQATGPQPGTRPVTPTNPRPAERPTTHPMPPPRVAPPPPTLPRHEERPIPRHEPIAPPPPPKKDPAPPHKEEKKK